MTKRRISTILLIACLICALLLSACGKKHEHTFSDVWECDENTHWHPATCEHDVRGDEEAHEYGPDGLCLMCDYNPYGSDEEVSNEYLTQKMAECCLVELDGKTITVTDGDSNFDVWSSKVLYEYNEDLTPGKYYEITFNLTGDNGVGEFFLCRASDIDNRYDETFTTDAGERSAIIKMDGNKLYIGMQFGNVGQGNTVSATLVNIRELSDEEVAAIAAFKMMANCEVKTDGNKITVTDTADNNDVWDSKIIYDAELKVEKGKTYDLVVKLTGEHGVGEFFVLKSDNIDDRYHETFTAEGGEHTLTFKAEGDKVYIGMQFGNVGKGNTVTAEIVELKESDGKATMSIPGLKMSEGCSVTGGGWTVTGKDTGTNADVWNSKLIYDAGISLESGQKYDITFSLSGTNGVGEFFLLKSANIDDRYHETFTNAAGQRTVTITAAGSRAYIGMQFGNVGSGNTVTARILKVQKLGAVVEPPVDASVKMHEGCTVAVSGNKITATDTSDNNDVWNSKLIWDAGLTLEAGKEYQLTYTLEGAGGVGEAFVTKSVNPDDRYDSTFKAEAGEHTVTFTAVGDKAYIGMQMGNIGKGKSVTLTVGELTEIVPERFTVKMTENIVVAQDGDTITVTSDSDETGVWTAKTLIDMGETLVAGKKYTVTYELAGENGVGEVFLCKSEDIDDRYDESFTSEAGEKTATIVAEDTVLYMGIQCGNIGKGNSFTVTVKDITKVIEGEQVHEAATEWSTNEEMHWHACQADDCDETFEAGYHTYGEWTADGMRFSKTCTVCGREVAVSLWQQNEGMNLSGQPVEGGLKITGTADDEAWHAKLEKDFNNLVPGKKYTVICEFTSNTTGWVTYEVYDGGSKGQDAVVGKNTLTHSFTATKDSYGSCLQLGSLGYWAQTDFEIVLTDLTITIMPE